MREAGLARDPVLGGDYTDVAGVRAAERLLAASFPTAIFAANDILATGVIDGLEDAGLRVPRTWRSSDTTTRSCGTGHHVSLTTINQPRPQMGREAVLRARGTGSSGGGRSR